MTTQQLRTTAPDNLVTVDDKDRPVEYLDMSGVAKWFGVSGKTVSVWHSRYAAKRDETGAIIDPGHPIPVADVVVGPLLGWAKDREPEWREWHATRPGQGSGGGPKPRRSSGGATAKQ